MTIDEKIQQALNAPDDCGYARLAKDLARFLQESRASATTATVTVTTYVGGWIPWAGGECPVDGDTQVYVRYRGGFDEIHAYRAKSFWWRHPWDTDNPQDVSCDIVAYKVVA